MTTEPTPPEETHSSPPQANNNPHADSNGMRQKQSFRRRRKRRGPSGGNPAPPQGVQPEAGAPAQAVAPQAAGSAPVIPSAPQGNGPRNENLPRKQKKRFFKKNRNQAPGQSAGQAQNPAQGQSSGPRPPNPRISRAERADSRGNSQQAPQKRGGSSKQRRPRVFVGPMDHSYRAANGNYSDAPPSTIELQRGYTNAHYNGNGNGNFNAEPAGMRAQERIEAGAAGLAPENTPARIYCFIDDLFFIAKIQETSRKLGIKVAFVKNDKETVAQLLALPEQERPALIVLDLNNANAKPLTLIPKLKLKLKRATSIVGFLSHLQGELKAKAIEAGCDSVMPRSAFSQTLPNLLRRYGADAEPEMEDSQAQILEA